ncbi:MAG: glutaminyl-tRNA synthase (glutamine-hydrolyzing) subunit B [SAR202 cluster bacterium Casp-Chloro-G4]|nr:Asp-tRNA(Asn)/Glu-tRNA(Gln) amidotransferase subunit GatB [Chloroflexota bacterium]MDA1228036.1 Asp-tRNA(Asn)/Glu-tRNA(Gln) amidotransferase subunit GatB [Chloroflexota bacterium]PKB61660.1 MAG: glutaminyl-tRNA synthase (glutamine-hydrolyzing) subunit B [SAR202 cluster bacterium Casp-Chloro-G4]
MDYEIVVGLEVHSQLLTQSKMFCSCSAGYQGEEHNTTVCPVCMGMPGVLPVINRQAIEYIIKTGLALGCTIAHHTKFDRKNYPYPDLMKGYQISQYDLPVASNGHLTLETDEGEKVIGITRVHMEEDVAKLFHRSEEFGEGYSLLDINRAGVPLMEIVSEPDMRSPEDARNYLTRLQSILRYIGVSSANMEEGNFRCDANISVRPVGAEKLGSKVEIKNMNSFRAVFRALEYEAVRQVKAVKEGERIVQETRGWDEANGRTFSQRIKEEENDYRYFPEPDLPPLEISDKWIDEIERTLPELPQARLHRFTDQFGLSAYDASLLTGNQQTADYFESVVKAKKPGADEQVKFAKSVSNWILVELWRLLNQSGDDIQSVKIGPADMVALIDMVDSGQFSSNMAKTVFEEMFNTGQAPGYIAEEKGLVQIRDHGAINEAIDEAISSNPDPVAEYLGGKDQAIRFLLGQVMKITRGNANPQLANELLKEKLDSLK